MIRVSCRAQHLGHSQNLCKTKTRSSCGFFWQPIDPLTTQNQRHKDIPGGTNTFWGGNRKSASYTTTTPSPLAAATMRQKGRLSVAGTEMELMCGGLNIWFPLWSASWAGKLSKHDVPIFQVPDDHTSWTWNTKSHSHMLTHVPELQPLACAEIPVHQCRVQTPAAHFRIEAHMSCQHHGNQQSKQQCLKQHLQHLPTGGVGGKQHCWLCLHVHQTFSSLPAREVVCLSAVK